MINDINNLLLNILESLEKDDIYLEKINTDLPHNYYVSDEKLNKVLFILLEICSTNQYSFSIYRDLYKQLKIVIFDKYTNETLDVLLFTSMPDKIDKNLENKYITKVKLIKKLNIVPVIGPDGVGKTTLLTEVMNQITQKIFYKRFKKIVRRSIIYNFLQPINKYFLTKKLGKKPEKDQHDDIHYFLSIFAGLGYYPYLFYKSLVKKNLVILDRFSYDYLLENISFMDKSTVLRKNWKFLLNFIPRPLWLIHLDATPEIILARKEELSGDDIIKYQKLNFEIYLKKPSVIYSYINTGIDLVQCKNILIKVGKENKIFYDKIK